MNLRKEKYGRTLLLSILCLIMSAVLIPTAVFGASDGDAFGSVSGSDVRSESVSAPVMAGPSLTGLFSSAPADNFESEEFIASAVFAQDTVTLYSAVNSQKPSERLVTGVNSENAVPQPLTVVAIITDLQNGVWYRLDTASWSDMIKRFCYIRSSDIIISDVPQQGRVLSVSVNGSDCSLSGKIPYGVTASINAVSPESIPGFGSDYPLCSNRIALDITLRDSGGSEWQPGAGESVTVSVPAKLISLSNGDYFFYYHIHNGKVEQSDAIPVRNGMLTFSADSFSSYVISGKTATIEADSFYTITGNAGNGSGTVNSCFFDRDGNFHILLAIEKGGSGASKFTGIKAKIKIGDSEHESAPGVEVPVTQITLKFTNGNTSSVTGKTFIDYDFGKVNVNKPNGMFFIITGAGGFDINPTSPNITFDMNYDVGKNLYSTETTVKPGDIVEYHIFVENGANSSFPLKGAVIIDNLPVDVFDLDSIVVSSDNRTTWQEPYLVSSEDFMVTMFNDVTIDPGERLDYYLQATISQTATQGQKKNGVTIAGTSFIDDSGETDVDIEIVYPDAAYVVRHYKQDQDGTNYTLDSTETFTDGILAFEMTEAEAKSYPGYTVKPFDQVQIGELDEYGQPTTYVDIYYDLNAHTVKYIVDGEENKSVEYRFGDTIADYTPDTGGFAFDGWYTDSGCTNRWTKPESMPDSDITVYGRITEEPAEEPTAKLTIGKTGMEPGERAIFTVTGDGLGTGLRVVVYGDEGSTTVSGLTLGKTYTVTEDNVWSWRYAANSSAKQATPTESKPEVSVSFSNTFDDVAWLCGETSAHNVFGKK